MSVERYDVFVGNLAFGTTEEHLREKFSFVGPVKGVRILLDKETGKPKGFAFVEFFDTNTALSAIRHLDQSDLGGRKIKVGYPAQSNLKNIARQIGQVAPESSADMPSGHYGADIMGAGVGGKDRMGPGGHPQFRDGAGMGAGAGGGRGFDGASGHRPAGHQGHMQHQHQHQQQQFSGIVGLAMRRDLERAVVVTGMSMAEAWDVLDAMKRLVASDNNKGHRAKAILETHPQLVSAIYEIQLRLGIVLPTHVQQQYDELDEVQKTMTAGEPTTTGASATTTAASANGNGSSFNQHMPYTADHPSAVGAADAAGVGEAGASSFQPPFQGYETGFGPPDVMQGQAGMDPNRDVNGGYFNAPASSRARYAQPPTLPPRQNGFFQHRRYVPSQQQEQSQESQQQPKGTDPGLGTVGAEHMGSDTAGPSERRSRFSDRGQELPPPQQQQYDDNNNMHLQQQQQYDSMLPPYNNSEAPLQPPEKRVRY